MTFSRALLLQGDLLALPAVAICLTTWLAIGLIEFSFWATRAIIPALARVLRTTGRAVWLGLEQDPLGAAAKRFVDPVVRRARSLLPLWRWIANRFRAGHRGIGLTVSIAAGLLSLFALLYLSTEIGDPRSTVSGFDLRVGELSSRLVVSGERRFMAALTAVGKTRSILVLLLALSGGMVLARARRAAVTLIAISGLSSLLVTIFKALHHRPRPAFGQLVETSTSFPSGHSAAALALAAGILVVAWKTGVRRLSLVAAGVLPLGFLVGYSRAYLNIHWISDVAAGWLIAIISATTVLAIDLWLNAKNRPQPSRRWPLVAAAIVMVGVAVFSGINGSRIGFPKLSKAKIELATGDVTDLLRHRPRFSETLFGRRMEPLGLVIVTSDDNLIGAITEGGWALAEPPTLGRLAKTYRAGLKGRKDPTAPVTPTFFDTRIQDIAIQRQLPGTGVKARHHARLWRLPVRTTDGCRIWVGTASLDDRVEWTIRTVLPNHHIAPAIDVEREFIVRNLSATGLLTDSGKIRIVPPTLGTNAAGDPFFTDGNAALLEQIGGCVV
ncbi:MAG: LssY C-terminal domain-containing protein [Actinomycetota bacterium]